MHHLIHDHIGFIHLISALVATVSGTVILFMAKGTNKHKMIGYGYVISMAVLNITAFLIYRLFGGFGVFHVAAIVSFATVLGGFIPVITKKPSGGWVEMHFSFMYWSVLGLYAAFASEVFTRIPETPFFGMVGIATFGIMAIGYFFWFKYKPKWKKQFKPKQKTVPSK